MNNVQRGIYQPRGHKLPIYELADDENPEVERSRAPLLVVIAPVLLAALIGVVWLAYTPDAKRVFLPEAAPASHALSGAAVIQVGAFESLELANAAWAMYRAIYPPSPGYPPTLRGLI